MTQINLLPWREQARQMKKIRFGITAGIFFSIAIFFALLTHLFFAGLISSQQKYNDFLQSQLNSEQMSLTGLNKDKEEQIGILKKLQFLTSMRTRSYQVVRLLNELPQVVPDAVLLLKISKIGNQISISGLAQSNLQVALLMENIAKSQVFDQPTLTEISEGNQPNAPGENFQLKVTQEE